MGKEGETTIKSRRSEGQKPEEVASAATKSSTKLTQSGDNKKGYTNREGRVPATKPKFTYGDLRRAIPAHCFERSLWKSSAYLVADLTGIALLYLFSTYFDAIGEACGTSWVTWGLWVAYWWFQGLFAVGLWVIAHECGHEAYSPYQKLNDTIGLFVHSAMLVPYFSWKFSHAKHHSKTGNVDKDEAFVPAVGKADEKGAPSVLYSAVNFVVLGLAGWVIYITTHIFGRDYGKRTDHFSPYSPLFKPKDRPLILLNDIMVGIVLFGLCYLGYSYSFMWLLKVYIIPYIHTHFWLVMITLMHHTDRRLPHFFDKDWNWLQGAISTVDRDYGWMLRTMTHHIGDTHVLHHLFSKIPHYHAEEASAAIIPILGDYYLKDDTPVWKAMWICTHECRKVYPENGDATNALWYDY